MNLMGRRRFLQSLAASVVASGAALPIGLPTDRDELADLIYHIEPTESPFLAAFAGRPSTMARYEWHTEVLA